AESRFYHLACHARCRGGSLPRQSCRGSQRPAGPHQGQYRGTAAASASPRRSLPGGIAKANSWPAWTGRNMVTISGNMAARESPQQGGPDSIERASRLSATFAERAVAHDRDGSFPFENFQDLSEAGLLSLTVPLALGG